MNIFLHLIATWWWTLQHLSFVTFPSEKQKQVSLRKQAGSEFSWSTHSPSQFCWKLLNWCHCVYLHSSGVCNDEVRLLCCRFIVQDCWREGPVLLSCAEHCAVLYDNRVFSMAPDGPCFHQPCRAFVKWVITFPVSILLEFNAAQRPAVTGVQCFVTQCCAALQGFSTGSCGMTLPFHGESHLFTLNCCCATFKFWDAWSLLWKQVVFQDMNYTCVQSLGELLVMLCTSAIQYSHNCCCTQSDSFF